MATILLVEDDAVLREGLTELFARDGYQVITAGSIRDAAGRIAGGGRSIVRHVPGDRSILRSAAEYGSAFRCGTGRIARGRYFGRAAGKGP